MSNTSKPEHNKQSEREHKEQWQADIDQRLKTAYELARAATPTQEGKKAIDFFYHVHLNNYPGFAHDVIATHLEAVKREARLDEALFHRYNRPPQDPNGEWIAGRIAELQSHLSPIKQEEQ